MGSGIGSCCWRRRIKAGNVMSHQELCQVLEVKEGVVVEGKAEVGNEVELVEVDVEVDVDVGGLLKGHWKMIEHVDMVVVVMEGTAQSWEPMKFHIVLE